MPREYDDDDDLPPVRRQPLSGLDAMYANTSMVVLIIFAFCCSGIAFILSLIAVLTCKDPTAKQNATTVLIISGIISVLGCGARIFQAMNQHNMGRF